MITDAPTVLLVEDNPDDEELILRGLRRTKLKNPVDLARDGQEALGYLYGNHDQAAKPVLVVVLLDLRLPRVDGFLKRIRAQKRTGRVPVVILTSSNEDRDLISGYDLEANSYVRKRIQFDEFATAIAQLSVYWLLINEPAPATDDHTASGAGGVTGKRHSSRVVVAGNELLATLTVALSVSAPIARASDAGSAQHRPPSLGCRPPIELTGTRRSGRRHTRSHARRNHPAR
jgi:CheY-like chemotaxis protein